MQKFLPHFAAILAFLCITFGFLSPLFEGKEILGDDTRHFLGMTKEISDYNATHDDAALWTGSMFGGMPAYQINMDQPTNVLTYLDRGLRVLPNASYRVFLYLLGFYLLLLAFGLNPWLAIAGAIAFAFGSYNLIIIVAGHNTKAVAIAYMAPVIGSIWLAFRRNPYLGAVLLALFLGLELQANHVQITYYTLFIVLCLGLSELIFTIRERKAEAWKSFGKALGLLVAGAVVAVGLNATRLMTTAEYVKATMRGDSTGLTQEGNDQHGLSKDYITAWSYGIDETLTLLIPDFKGGPSAGTLEADSHTGRAIQKMSGYPEGKPLTSSQMKRLDKQKSNPNFRPRNLHELMYTFDVPLYWGTQPFTAGPVYAGAIVCFLFLLGLMLVPQRERWWLLGAAVLGIVLSWGKNFMPLTSFFIDYVPLYGKFRTVSMTLTITCLAMALLAMLAVREWMDKSGDARKRMRALYIAGGIAGGVCLLFALFPGLAGDFVSERDAAYSGGMEFLKETLPLDRAALLRADAFRSLLLIASAFALLWVYQRFDKLHMAAMAGGLALLMSVDLIPVAHRYLNSSHFVDARQQTNPFKPCDADRAVLADHDGQFRVLNLNRDVFNTSEPSYFYKTVGGYSAVKLRRYQELVEMALVPEIQRVSAALGEARNRSQIDSVFGTASILNMLNTRYVVYNDHAEPLRNPHAFGTAWLVKQVSVVPDADAEMAALSQTDLASTLVVDQTEAEGLADTYNPAGSSIVQRSYSPNELVYDYEGLTPQLAVFSEVYYYTGWHAFVDGEEVPIRRADWLLRACELPAGKHEVVLRFHPDSYFNGKIFALISSLLLTFAFLGIIFVRILAKKKASR